MLRRTYRFHAVSLLSLALTACGAKHVSDPRTEAPLVRVVAAHEAPGSTRAFSGVVAARVQSDLGFRVPGKVVERLVDTGQAVRRGQPLMRIDPIDLGLQEHSQQELVDAAKARATQTAADEARYRDLVAAGAVSASTYDQIKEAADSAKAQLIAAQAQASVAKNASGYSELVADADGVVVETLAEPGHVVSAGEIVVRLAHVGPREAIVQLPETIRPALGSIAQASLYGADGTSVPAKLRQLSDAADRLTRTYEARYVLSGALADAPLGATVAIRLSGDDASRPAELEVPIGALFDPGTGAGVWTIEGSPSHASWHKVQVVGLADETAYVTGTLHDGDAVVALGAQLIHEGEPVRVASQGETAASVASRGSQP